MAGWVGARQMPVYLPALPPLSYIHSGGNIAISNDQQARLSRTTWLPTHRKFSSSGIWENASKRNHEKLTGQSWGSCRRNLGEWQNLYFACLSWDKVRKQRAVDSSGFFTKLHFPSALSTFQPGPQLSFLWDIISEIQRLYKYIMLASVEHNFSTFFHYLSKGLSTPSLCNYKFARHKVNEIFTQPCTSQCEEVTQEDLFHINDHAF